MIAIKATEKTIDSHIELMLEDEPFAGITFYYEGMKMADQENEDGSMNMTFEYSITSDKRPEDLVLFERTLGDLIIQILTDQMEKGEVVYKGGTNDDESRKV